MATYSTNTSNASFHREEIEHAARDGIFQPHLPALYMSDEYDMTLDEEFARRVQRELCRSLSDDSDVSEYLVNLRNRSTDLSFGFGSMCERNMNQNQKSVFEKYKDECCIIYEYIRNEGYVVDPGSYLYGRLVNKDKLLSINDNNNHVYYMPGTGKVGMTSNGSKRIANYKTEEDNNPILHSMIDLDHININIQPKLTQLILNLVKMFSPNEYPSTLGDVLLLDKNGLPASLQLRFRSLTKSAEECTNCGGTLAVRGVLIACIRIILETGAQASLKNRGIKITGDVHEASLNNVTGLFAILDEEVCDDIDKLFKNVFTDEEKKSVSENSILPSTVYNSWKPHHLTTTPEKFVTATEVIMDTIFQDVPWSDVFVNSPHNGVCSSIEEAYDAKGGYTDEDRTKAVNKLLEAFHKVEERGGFAVVDSNKEACNVMETGDIVKYLTTVHKTTFDKNKWTIVHKFRGITVLMLENEGDNLLRIIVVFRPLCTMMHNINGKTIEWHDLKKYENAALSAQWLYEFTRIMRNEGSEPLVANRSLDRLTENNFVFQFCNFLSDLKFLHINAKSSAQLFKNGLSGNEQNLNNNSHTNLLRSGDLYLFGRHANRRAKAVTEDGDGSTEANNEDDNSVDAKEKDDGSIEDEEEGGDENVKTKHKRDNFYVRYAIAMGTCGPKNDKEAAAAIFDAISHNVDDAFRKRIKQVTKFLPLEITALIKQLYEATCPTITQIRDVDTLLSKYAESGEKFFVQADGSAKQPPTNGSYSGVPGSGTPFLVPQEGTELRAEPGSVYPNVIFRANDFVPITFSGLISRTTKPSRSRKGNTNAARAVSFIEYKVEYTKGISRISSGKIQYMNTGRVIEVRLLTH